MKMQKSRSPQMIKTRKEKLTLRQRITLLTTGVVFALGLILILLINLVATIFITNEVGSPDTQVLVNTVDAEGNPITILAETPGSEGYTIYYDPGLTRADPLTAVRALSLIGLAVITGLGFLASRWVAQKSLQPVKQISQTAQRISARNLGQRLNYQGAQDEVKVWRMLSIQC